jgi:hypothetical protein
LKIYTSSWFTALPVNIARIGISRGTPRSSQIVYSIMRELAPGSWFRSISPSEYRRLRDQLAALDAQAVVNKIERLSGGRDVALLCFERPDDTVAWCHRGLVSVWLADQLGCRNMEWTGMAARIRNWAHWPGDRYAVRRQEVARSQLRGPAARLIMSWRAVVRGQRDLLAVSADRDPAVGRRAAPRSSIWSRAPRASLTKRVPGKSQCR